LANCLNIMGKTSLPSLYVCGVPGIGKTLTILKVTDWFTKQHFGQVKCIYLNGM
jgi:signal recognition particle GTPase